MLVKPSDIKVEVTIIRVDGAKEILGAVNLFNEGNVDDNGLDIPNEECSCPSVNRVNGIIT